MHWLYSIKVHYDAFFQNWHKGAAAAAQRWSQECMFLTHDNVTGRYIQEYGTCGQNIFVANKKVPWLVPRCTYICAIITYRIVIRK